MNTSHDFLGTVNHIEIKMQDILDILIHVSKIYGSKNCISNREPEKVEGENSNKNLPGENVSSETGKSEESKNENERNCEEYLEPVFITASSQ